MLQSLKAFRLRNPPSFLVGNLNSCAHSFLHTESYLPSCRQLLLHHRIRTNTRMSICVTRDVRRENLTVPHQHRRPRRKSTLLVQIMNHASSRRQEIHSSHFSTEKSSVQLPAPMTCIPHRALAGIMHARHHLQASCTSSAAAPSPP